MVEYGLDRYLVITKQYFSSQYAYNRLIRLMSQLIFFVSLVTGMLPVVYRSLLRNTTGHMKHLLHR